MIIGLSISAVVLMGLICLVLLWPHRKLNPLFLFVAVSCFFSVTTLGLIDFSHSSDQKHVILIIMYNLSIVLYIFSGHDFRVDNKVKSHLSGIKLSSNNNINFTSTVLILLVCLFVSYIYFKFLVGYNLAFSAFLGDVEDFTAMRLASYSGSAYTGAGVVNQFKNTILPVSYFALIAGVYYKYGKLSSGMVALAISPFFIWAIMGTGQRAYLFFSMAGLLIYLNAVGRINYRALFFVFALSLVLFGYQSYQLGRTDGMGVITVALQFFRRLCVDNQIATVEGFRYASSLDIQFGEEWMRALLGLVPGIKGSDLAHRVHEYMYGSDRGTAPVALWVSIYHNFGIWFVFPFMFLFLKAVDGVRSFLLKATDPFHVLIFSFCSFYIGIAPISDFVQIINNGVLGLLFALVMYISLKKTVRLLRLKPRMLTEAS